MKYLEGGSIGVAEQGGLKAEVAEAVTRRCSDKRSPMRASDNDDNLDWTDLRRRSGLDRSNNDDMYWTDPISVCWLEAQVALLLL